MDVAEAVADGVLVFDAEPENDVEPERVGDMEGVVETLALDVGVLVIRDESDEVGEAVMVPFDVDVNIRPAVKVTEGDMDDDVVGLSEDDDEKEADELSVDD